ncbi:sensor histidine kinase [Ruminococcus sp. 5_1_39BFAA]|uniref:cache domain-containing sensor histidine kinase n=1 Tax=Ruminococcus sp. 5_1_39BFAA TaxID=457412 RepID=UPI0035696A7A
MKRLKNWFMNLRIQKKLLYFALGITMVVLLAAGISLYTVASRMVMEQTEQQFEGVVDELAKNLDHYFELVEHSFNYIANNNIVQEELKSDSPYRSDGEEGYTYYSTTGQIRRLLLRGYTSVYMNDIQLYGYNGANHLLYNGQNMAVSQEEAVLEKAEEAKGSCVYCNVAEEEGLIYVAKQIKDSLTMEPLGLLRASIKVSYLEKLTETVQESFNAEVFLLDENNGTVLKSMGYDVEELTDQFSGVKGSFLEKTESQTYDCVYRKSSRTGFTLAGMAPMSFLRKAARELQKTAILLVLFSVVLCAVLTSYLARGIAGPIERTSSAMNQFAGGDFTVRLPEGRTDEIGNMNSVFNRTIEDVEALLKKVVEMETANKDIEFQALQAQINPHFLYNVLDTINWMARKKGEENICHMVTAISNLMRGTISNKKSMVSIREEIKYVQDYIYIQETRYGDKFTSYLEVDEELDDILIPKMTIQTLAENAVVHGVENATWDCFLSVIGERVGDMAVIRVRDNGVGIPAAKLERLTNPETDWGEQKPGDGKAHTRLGIYAVRKRLDYVYDGTAEMNIFSEEGKGTEVILKIPLKEIRRFVIDGTSGNDIG